jgi:hypothetical protein
LLTVEQIRIKMAQFFGFLKERDDVLSCSSFFTVNVLIQTYR